MAQYVLTRDKTFYSDLIRIALPIALQNLIMFGLNMLDTVMIGAVGEDELAAVGQANQPFFIFTLFLFGIASGSSILISQYWGKKDKKTISSLLGFSISLSVIVALIASVIVFCFPTQLMRIYIADETVISMGANYLRIVVFSYVLSAVSTTYLSLIRATEQVKTPLKINIISLGTNAVLNYIFIFGKCGFPKMGIAGAAIATVIARVFELLMVGYIALNKDAIISLKLRNFFHMKKVLIKDFLHYSGPVILNETLWGIGVSIYSVILGKLGASAVASYNVVQVWEKLACVALFGMSNATIILLGKHIGSGKHSREDIMCYAKTTMVLALGIGLLCGGLVILAKPAILMLYRLPDDTIRMAEIMLNIVGISLVFKALSNITIVGILRSGGDSRFSLLADVSGLWLVGIPCGLVALYVFHAPAVIVYACFSAEQIYKSIVCILRASSGKWIRNVTR